MLEEVKKFGTIVIIAILFSFFCFSIVELIDQSPRYDEYCFKEQRPLAVKIPDKNCTAGEVANPLMDDCYQRGGFVEITYDENGCAESYECNMCQKDLEEAEKHHRLIGFIVTSILGIIAIMLGIYSMAKEEVRQWILSGFLIGGIISVFLGTAIYFRDMGRFLKPLVLLGEMILIIWIALKTKKK